MDQQLSVEARVKECFAEMLGLSVSEIDLSSTLSELGGDSLDAIEIVMCLEEDFDVEFGFDLDEVAEISVGGIVYLLEAIPDRKPGYNIKLKEYNRLISEYDLEKNKGQDIVRAPERRVFFIDVGNMPPQRVKAYLESIKNEMKQKRIPNVDLVKSCCGGCCKSDQKPENHQKRWSVEEEQALVYNYAAGTAIDLIAKVMGRTEVSILQRLTQLGLVTFNRADNAYYTMPALLYKFE